MPPKYVVPSTAHPKAIDLANQIDKLHGLGYGSLDPNITIALANGPVETPMMGGILDSIKSGFSKATTFGTHILSDPALSKTPTTAQKVAWHFYNNGDPVMIQENLKKTQEQMIKKGYAPKGAEANGVWNSAWNQSKYEMNVAEMNKPGFGAIQHPLNTALDVLGGGILSHAVPLILDNMKSTLHGLSKVLADSSQAVVDLAAIPFQTGLGQDEVSLGDQVAAAIKSLDRLTQHKDPMSAMEYHKSYAGMKDVTDATGTLLTAWSYASLAGGLAKATAMTGGKNAFTLLLKEAVSPKFTILNSLVPVTAAGGRRFALTKWMQNMPVLGSMYAPLGEVATLTGKAWQSLRMAAATPYRLPIVGAIGKAGAEVMTTGLKQGAIGKTQSGVGDPLGPQAQTLDQLKPIAGVLGATMDLLSIGLHAPHYDLSGNKKEAFGKVVEDARKKVADGLDQNSVLAEWERATKTDFGKVAKEAVKRGIPVDAIRMAILDDASRHAALYQARHEADVLTAAGKITSDADKQMIITSRAHEIRNDPKIMKAALDSYMLHPGQFSADLASSMLGLAESKKAAFRNSYLDKIEVDEIMRNSIIPHINELVTPTTFKKNLGLPLGKEDLVPSIGYARIDTQTSDMVQSIIYKLGAKLKKVNPEFDVQEIVSAKAEGLPFTPKRNYLESATTPAEKAIREEAFNYLVTELGVNTREMQFYSTEDLLHQINIEKPRLSYGDIIIPDNAPTALIEGERAMRAKGYKLVFGTDLGHLYNDPIMDLDKLGAEQSKLSRVADDLGINFAKVEPSISGSQQNTAMLTTIQEGLNDTKKFPYGSTPAWMTASRGVQYLRSVIQPEMGIAAAFGFSAATGKLKRIVSPLKGGRWEEEIASYIDKNKGATRYDAINFIREQLTQNTDPRFWTKAQVVDALMAKETIMVKGVERENITSKGYETMGAGMDRKQAEEFYYLLQKGLRSTPAYVEGFNPFNKMIDSSFGFGGMKLPIIGTRLPNPGGWLKRELLGARYQGSLAFAGLRVTKSAIKGLTESIPFSMNAEQSMKLAGTYAQDMKIRDFYLPKQASQDQLADQISMEFEKNDIWNVYNPKAIEARILGFLHRDALAKAGGIVKNIDKEAVIKKFDDIYSYGNRTAAEKSVNAVFFPFSFEKTVMRQVGGGLLNSSGSRLMLAAALTAYDSAQGQDIKNWMEKNAPLFAEVERFNPYRHGIALGQVGGINRLYFDLARETFIKWMNPVGITSQDGLKAVLNTIPALRDLNSILLGISTTPGKPNQLGGKLGITGSTAAFELNQLFSNLSKDTEKYKPHALLPYDKQISNGWNFRSRLLTQYSKYLADNQKSPGRWQFDKNIPRVGGESITRQNINFLVSHVYPKWDPMAGLKLSADDLKAASDERYTIQKKHPKYLDMYDQFVKDSKELSSRLNSDYYADSMDVLVSDTMAMRQSAIELSMQDKTFYDFYKKHYESKFGQLEGVK